MKDTLRNGILAGIGFFSIGKKRFLKLYKDLIKEGEITKEESEFLKKNWSKFETLTDRIEKFTGKLIEITNLATRTQIERINERIDKLIKELKSR